ncbi:MAG TPA: diguanylate cyclase [Thermoanaerobaculia bacterium]|nr:diguanylate cyclase [Thermoanaerobaculia bacterium]
MRAKKTSRAVLAWAIALSVGSLLFVQGQEAVRNAGRRLGFLPVQGGRGVHVNAVFPGGPADRGGLRAGDEILAAGGRRVVGMLEYGDAARRFEPGRPVLLQVARAGRTLDLTVVPGIPLDWLPLLLNVLTAVGFLAVALLALTQEAELKVGLLLAFCAAVAVEIALPVNVIGRPALLALFSSGYYLLTGLQIAVEMHLTSLIPERPGWLRRRSWIVPVYYVIGCGVGILSCATYLSEQALGRRVFPWTVEQADHVLQDGVLPLWALGLTLLLTSQALRHTEPRGRHQAGLVLAATIPWMLFTVATTALDLSGHQLPAWINPFETLILLCYPVAFFAAIFRYHLFDIELAVRRGLIYTLLTSALVLVFYAALGAGGAVFSHWVEGRESVWAVSGATLLLGLLFSPLRRALHRVIDRRFFPERYALRQQLIALAGELPALGKLPRMGRHLVERLTSIFHARSATLLIANPETGLLSVLASMSGAMETGVLFPLDDPGVEHLRRAGRPLPVEQLAFRSPAFAHHGPEPDGLAVPLLSQERLIGILIVGRKEGSRSWPAEELDLLSLLAHHVATVFENARLFESATYEELTGLLRREAILEQLDRELDRALRYGRPLTIAMADLDHFKDVNDRHGHLAGDSLLRRMSQILAGGLRSTDWIGRYGGEEFLLVLPETGMEGAAAVAEKIRDRVQGTLVPLDDGTPVHVTVSIGLASLDEAAGRASSKVTVRDLIAAADRSLYAAKNAGRNRVFPRVA